MNDKIILLNDDFSGADIQPKRDLTRFVRWPRYIRVQRQRTILQERMKIPPTLNQFRSGLLDRQSGMYTRLFIKLDINF